MTDVQKLYDALLAGASKKRAKALANHTAAKEAIEAQEAKRAAYHELAAAYKAVRDAALSEGRATRAYAIPDALLLAAQDSGYALREIAEHIGMPYGSLRQTVSIRGLAFAGGKKNRIPLDGRRNHRRDDTLELMRSLGIEYDVNHTATRLLASELSAALARYDRAKAREKGLIG